MTEVIDAPSIQYVEELLGEHNNWIDDLPEEYEVVEEGEWEQEHKSQFNYAVIKHLPSGTFYGISRSRSGDYWSGYEVDVDYIEKVRKVEVVKTVTEWVAA